MSLSQVISLHEQGMSNVAIYEHFRGALAIEAIEDAIINYKLSKSEED